jgi:AcrR family transcriptional regulator
MKKGKKVQAFTRQERGAAAKQKLIEAGLKIYSEVGFQGASTRNLAAAAGVNIAAIPYYFDSKEGLYLAVIDHVVEYYQKNLGEGLDRIRLTLAGEKATKEELLALLDGYIRRMLHFMLQDKGTECARISKIYAREQLDPTSAFEKLYQGFIKVLRETLEDLVAAILDRDSRSSEVRLITITLIGQVTVFKTSRVSVLHKMEWDTYDEEKIAEIEGIVASNVNALMQAYQRKDSNR